MCRVFCRQNVPAFFTFLTSGNIGPNYTLMMPSLASAFRNGHLFKNIMDYVFIAEQHNICSVSGLLLKVNRSIADIFSVICVFITISLFNKAVGSLLFCEITVQENHSHLNFLIFILCIFDAQEPFKITSL